ncbi:MAG: DUF5107 domain-containing protein [Anaerolineae bacterium]
MYQELGRLMYRVGRGHRVGWIQRARLGPSLLAVLLLLVSCSSPAGPPDSTATPATGTLQVVSLPAGAVCLLDGQSSGTTPAELTLAPGEYRVRLELEGFRAAEMDVDVLAGRQAQVSQTLRDIAAPKVHLAAVPTQLGPEDGLKVIASALDNVGVARMALSVGSQVLHQVDEASLRYNIDTRTLDAGAHRLVVEAWDLEGNVARVEQPFEITTMVAQQEPTAPQDLEDQPTPTQPVGELTQAGQDEGPEGQATATPTTPSQAPSSRVEVTWGEITIDTYAYEDALYTDPDRVGHPYSLLARDRIGGPRPKTYQVLRMRNEYLELTLLPALGGRIYQARFLPTGQDLFYNNSVIKPSHWGPADQEWWLAAGGMEWCLPVDEHGYVTAEPWQPHVIPNTDGSATVSMRIEERSRRIATRVDITLKPGEGSFHLRTTLTNMDAESKSFQFWMNAMLAPGAHSVTPGLRFYYPTSEVVVHSRGDSTLPDAHATMAWPVHNGRDLGSYANWRNWLGFFAPNLRQPYTAVYDDGSELGMVRVFPSDVAQGAKLFAFGEGFDSAPYTDDGSQYVEMWGGLTPTFWDYATLEPNATVSWDETWYVLARSGGPSLANAEASLHVSRTAEYLDIVVASPGEHDWTLRVTQGDAVLLSETASVRPDSTHFARIPLSTSAASKTLLVTLTDPSGRIVLAYTA